ncbi:hypothetical protein [Streptomyces sp. KHY 26]|uniref:hypothetical protein n=1 Tax=Streptomyces sp. KHY 26 TaxID=3097359 RepID=UPI00376F39B9
MRADSVRRALRLGARTTLAAGLVTLALTTAPAFAGTQETDQLWITAPYEPTLPLGIDGGTPLTRTLDVRLNHDNAHFTVTGGRLVVDASGLAGVPRSPGRTTAHRAARPRCATCPKCR